MRKEKCIWNNPNFRYVAAFVIGVQKLTALQPLARAAFFTNTFGETEGAIFTERFDKYGVWFLINQFTFEQQNTFYDAVFEFTAAQKINDNNKYSADY